MLNASDKYLARVAQTTTAKRKGSDSMLKRSRDLETQMEQTLKATKEEVPKFEEVRTPGRLACIRDVHVSIHGGAHLLRGVLVVARARTIPQD